MWKFDNLFVTSGIVHSMPMDISGALHKMINNMEVEKDYLQIFELENIPSRRADNDIQSLTVVHRQEKPEYSKTYTLPLSKDSIDFLLKQDPIESKIYVISEGDACVMMFASEY